MPELDCDAAEVWHFTDQLNVRKNQPFEAANSDESTFDSRSRAGGQSQGTLMFVLTDDDMVAIDVATRTVRQFLRNEKLDARQIVGLGNALYALQRLPEVTDGVACEFGLMYRHGGESRYIEFEVSEHAFGISVGGTNYELNVGGDSFSQPGWRVEVGGSRDDKNPNLLYNVSDQISEFVCLGAEIVVHDESTMVLE